MHFIVPFGYSTILSSSLATTFDLQLDTHVTKEQGLSALHRGHAGWAAQSGDGAGTGRYIDYPVG